MHKLALFLMVITALYMVSCSAPGPTFTATNGDYAVEVEFAHLPTINQSVATTLRFTYLGKPIGVQNVVCDLQMPGMVMGSMRPIADVQTDGSHLVNLLFTMDGEWGIIITGDSDQGPIRLYVDGIVIAADSALTPTTITP